MALTLVVTLLSGCTVLGAQADDGTQTGFVAGDGTWELIPEQQRGAPVELTGPATDGSTIDLAALRGQVVVVNVWYAACAPCRIEAPDLAAASRDYASAGVQFVGLNTRDTAGAANAFERRFGITYPSVLDADSGQALLALRGVVPPAAVPTTIVIDTTGRPAGRIVGAADPAVLRGMIEQVAGIAPQAPAAGSPSVTPSDAPSDTPDNAPASSTVATSPTATATATVPTSAPAASPTSTAPSTS